jgi:hypothetical protein
MIPAIPMRNPWQKPNAAAAMPNAANAWVLSIRPKEADASLTPNH